MRKLLARILAVILTVLIAVPVITVPTSADVGTAFTYVTGANGISSSYKNSKFYEKLSKITLTGDGRTDVIAVALTQAGYLESSIVNDFSGVNGGKKDYCEYNYNMGDWGYGYGGGPNGYQWCASFVSWALLQSRVYSIKSSSMGDWTRYHDGVNGKLDVSYMWREVGVGHWANQIKRAGYFKNSRYKGGNYTPQTGDIIFYSWDGTNYAHVGLVVYADATNVYTVEGNTSDKNGLESNGGCCSVKVYALNSQYIMGYGAMPYKENPDAKIDFSGKNRTAGYYMNTDANMNMYANESCSGAAGGTILRHTMFEVTEVCSNGMLKVIATISNGTVQTGYINPTQTRVFQLTSSAPAEKKELQNLVGVVKNISFKNYSEATLTQLRTAYNEAVALLGSSNAKVADYVAAYNKLDALYKTTGVNEYANGVYVTAFNEFVTPGSCKIFTSKFNDGNFDTTTAGHTWSMNVKAKWDSEANAYRITQIISLATGSAPAVSLESDEIMISAHNWETGLGADADPPAVIGSAENASHVVAAQVGQKIITFGIDIENLTLSPAAYFVIVDDGFVAPAETQNLSHNKPYTISGSNKGFEYDDPQWGYSSYQAKLTDGLAPNSLNNNDDWFGFYSGDVIPPNTENGIGTVTIDLGKNYNIAKIRAHLRNYNSASVQAPKSLSASVMVDGGNEFVSVGSFTINTDDNAIYWADLSCEAVGRYVKLEIALNSTFAFMNEIEVYGTEYTAIEPEPDPEPKPEPKPDPEPEPDFVVGDVNGNGKIDARDYLLLKRAYFGTYTLTCADAVSDINGNGKIDARDYLLLKRAYFGTYTIQ